MSRFRLSLGVIAVMVFAKAKKTPRKPYKIIHHEEHERNEERFVIARLDQVMTNERIR